MSRFKELRKKIGLTQEELIEQFNLNYGKKYTPAAISQFENNKRIPENLPAPQDQPDFSRSSNHRF